MDVADGNGPRGHPSELRGRPANLSDGKASVDRNIVIGIRTRVAGVDILGSLADDLVLIARVAAESLALRPRVSRIDQITPHPLWVGHSGDGSQPRRLHDLGIEAVVHLAAEEAPLSLTRDLMYHRFPILDGSGNSPEVLLLAVTLVASMIRLRIPTLVCCGMGLSRSPAITAAALAMVRRESPDQALRMLADLHPVDISPALWREVRAVPMIRLDGEILGFDRQP